VSSLRPRVRALLERGDFPAVLELVAVERGVARALVSLLYDPDETVRWRAVSALGHLAGTHPELARPLVTRLLWTLNDESGGIGWMSAPALGEIGRRAPELLRDAVRVVVHYLEDPTLLSGALWAIGRLAPAYPDETREIVPKLEGLCTAADPAVRAHAALALGEIGEHRASGALRSLATDDRPARVYRDGELVVKPVRDWAEVAAVRLRSPAVPH
jgi:HEAT repeat protein